MTPCKFYSYSLIIKMLIYGSGNIPNSIIIAQCFLTVSGSIKSNRKTCQGRYIMGSVKTNLKLWSCDYDTIISVNMCIGIIF